MSNLALGVSPCTAWERCLHTPPSLRWKLGFAARPPECWRHHTAIAPLTGAFTRIVWPRRHGKPSAPSPALSLGSELGEHLLPDPCWVQALGSDLGEHFPALRAFLCFPSPSQADLPPPLESSAFGFGPAREKKNKTKPLAWLLACQESNICRGPAWFQALPGAFPRLLAAAPLSCSPGFLGSG